MRRRRRRYKLHKLPARLCPSAPRSPGRRRRRAGTGRPTSGYERLKAGVRLTGAACAKKGRIVGGVGCPPNCRTSGKPWGSSGEAPTLSNFFEKCCILQKSRKKMVKFGENSAKFGQIWENLRNFGKKQQKIQRFLTKILRLESGAKECIV